MALLRDRWHGLLPTGADERDDLAARRAAQGRAFYRSGRVTGLRVGPGRLSASVQGARATPYHVEAMIPVLAAASWTRLVTVVAAEVRFAAALLAGRLPDALLERLDEEGVHLLGDGARVDARCPCGEAGRPCAHVAALWEAAADRFTEDPFALLQLRGRGRQRLLADLSAARPGAGAGRRTRIALDELSPARWERADADLSDIAVAPSARPDVKAAPLRLLGDPPGWKGAQTAYASFAPLLAAAAEQAEALLLGTDEPA